MDPKKNNAQLWIWLVMEVKSNVIKKKYCIGTWNVRSMNQSKLEVIKQEMERVNINILGISEQNGPEWLNLIQMTIISITVGKNAWEDME